MQSGFYLYCKGSGNSCFQIFPYIFGRPSDCAVEVAPFCFRCVLDHNHRNSSVLFIPVLFLWRQRNASLTRVSVTFFLLHTTDISSSADSRSCYRMKWRTWLYLWKSHGLVALLRCSLWFCTCVLEVICLTPGICVQTREKESSPFFSS